MTESEATLWATPEQQEALAEAHGGESEQGHHALSYSRLSSYRRCGEQYRLRHVENVPSVPHGSALAGSAVHHVNEVMIAEGWWNDPDAVENEGARIFQEDFDRRLAEVGGPDACRWGGYKRILYDEETGKPVLDEEGNKVKVGENYQWFTKMGPTFVKRAGAILRRDVQNGLHVVEASVERSVAAWLDGPGSTLITGKIDLMLLADDEGHPRVRDLKSGSHIDPIQLANYAWLLRNIEDPAKRITSDVGEIAYLRGQTPDKWIRTYDLTEWLPIVPRMFRDMVKALESDVFQLNPSSWCGSCSVREHCEYGRTLPE